MSPSRDYDALRRQSLPWVRQAGRIAVERFGKAITSRKADDSPVTDADHAVQAALLRAIAARYPRDAVVTEETQADPGKHAGVASARRCWVIDPIDGTRNYARAVPFYCLSVALMEDGMPVVGIIYNPATGETFSAAAGAGAWLGRTRLPAGDPPPRMETVIATPSGQRNTLPTAVHGWFNRYKLRNTGSTALHLAYLASGGFDAVLLTECHIWDIAAGWLIARETGVVTRSLDGRELFPMDLAREAGREISFLAAHPALLDRLWVDLQQA